MPCNIILSTAKIVDKYNKLHKIKKIYYIQTQNKEKSKTKKCNTHLKTEITNSSPSSFFDLKSINKFESGILYFTMFLYFYA